MWDANACPTAPPPETKLMTPGGKPALAKSGATCRTPSGVFSEALKTTVFPAARAAAALNAK
jgi:hypothetical protein